MKIQIALLLLGLAVIPAHGHHDCATNEPMETNTAKAEQNEIAAFGKKVK
jgi:hypothetical protein